MADPAPVTNSVLNFLSRFSPILLLLFGGLTAQLWSRFRTRTRRSTWKETGSVEGDLTIHGVTRKVHFAVEGPTRLPRIPGATLGSRSLQLRRSIVKTSV